MSDEYFGISSRITCLWAFLTSTSVSQMGKPAAARVSSEALMQGRFGTPK